MTTLGCDTVRRLFLFQKKEEKKNFYESSQRARSRFTTAMYAGLGEGGLCILEAKHTFAPSYSCIPHPLSPSDDDADNERECLRFPFSICPFPFLFSSSPFVLHGT